MTNPLSAQSEMGVWACQGCGRVARSYVDLLHQGCEGKPEPYVPMGVDLELMTEIARLRAGIQWARGMCSDGEPLETIDAYLGGLLR